MAKLPDDAEGRYVFGVTVKQIDTPHRSIDMISAEFAAHTLPVVGQVVFEGASAVRGIIRQLEWPRVRQAHGSQAGVGENLNLKEFKGSVAN